MRTRQITLLLGFIFVSLLIRAQEEPQLTAEEISAYSEQSKQMVSYLEGTLNFLGDPNEVASEKEIIINESFIKLFQSDEVQIEDDLDENREIPISKDVQAYLKDIDFFYKTVTFTFEVNSVEQFVNERNQVYFKVTTSRNLQGITVDDDTVNNNQVRYLEVNLDPYKQELKIASIYTTQPDVRRQLRYWWNEMSPEWKNFFSRQADTLYDTLALHEIVYFEDSLLVVEHPEERILFDSVIVSEGDTLSFEGIDDSRPIVGDIVQLVDTVIVAVPDTLPADVTPIYEQLKTLSGMKVLDISGDSTLTTLDAVSQLTHLVEINLSNTPVTNLSPLRNLNKLEKINCSGAAVRAIDDLRYASNLTSLDISNTGISDLSVVANFRKLNHLNLSYSAVTSLHPLAGLPVLSQLSLSGISLNDPNELRQLTALTNLDLSNSEMENINPLDSLFQLQNLNIDSTSIVSLAPLGKLESLSTIEANHSSIADLSPLENLTSLSIIYCDNSEVNEAEAIRFMQQNENCLVIYNTEKLRSWWDEMPETYKDIIRSKMSISQPVTTEEMHAVINQTKVDLSGHTEIQSIEPLKMLHRLQELNIEGTPIRDLSPLSGLTNLKMLNLNNTNIEDLSPLATLNNLKTIRCENTKVSDLLPLQNSLGLQMIYCDGSNVHQPNVLKLKQSVPECLVIYQTSTLQSWWTDLSTDWQAVFHEQIEMDDPPTGEQLQALVDLTSISVNDNSSIRSLNPLFVFVRLTELNVNKTVINDISPITALPNLRILNLPNNPISDLATLDQLTNLEELNIENTSVEELELVGTLSRLRVLNITGTKIKSLKPLRDLQQLEKLYINNTDIKSLKFIDKMESLTTLRCYNTKLKASKVEDFKSAHPGVEVIF
jgi:Leucine-rich repeat (LRR) protein